MPEPGGMLRYGIPSYRLPREELERDIERIRSMGVKIVCNAVIGETNSMEKLREDFDAIFIGSGAWADMMMGVPGEDASGVSSGIEFLKKAELGPVVPITGDVVVVGGGNTAMDVARTVIRLGSSSVTVVYRRTREEMPVQPEEVTEALEEGVKFEFLVAPAEVICKEGNSTVAIKLQRMELGKFDDSGRRRPVPVEGSYFELPAENIIRAIGQKAIIPNGGPPASKWGTINVDDFTLATDFDGVFAGGDAVLGPATAVQAVAHGRKAAETIERYLHTGKPAQFPWIKPRALDTAFDPMAAPSDTARCEAIKLDPQERRFCFDEVELSLSATDARLEAARCLRCDFGKVFVSRGGEQ